MRIRPDLSVVQWVHSQNPAELFISVITLGELHYGVARLAQGAKRRALQVWVSEIENRFADRVVVMDEVVARRWGSLRAASPNTPVADSQIAATALAYDFVFATRNVKDFRFDGLKVVNPWEA
jgi:predicted nucleic acid-binding protein